MNRRIASKSRSAGQSSPSSQRPSVRPCHSENQSSTNRLFPRTYAEFEREIVVERVRTVLQLSRKRQRTGWAVERSDRARTHGCAPRRGFNLREIARREGRCQRRPSDQGTREICVILYAKDDPFCAPAPADERSIEDVGCWGAIAPLLPNTQLSQASLMSSSRRSILVCRSFFLSDITRPG
jgi:hypothetical protein